MKQFHRPLDVGHLLISLTKYFGIARFLDKVSDIY